jgi:serine/threonine protein kinase
MTSKVGTFVWMAPEVDNDNNRLSSYTKAADMWSYGILLWELFSKKKPELCKELVLQRTSANPLSPVLTELIKTCLHPEPGSRPTFVGLLKSASATGVLTLDYVAQNSR